MKTNLICAGALALSIIALVACAAPPPTATPVPPPPTPVPPPDPASQIKALVDVLNAGNIDAALAFFTDDATQTQLPPPSGTTGIRAGKEQIRGFYKGLIDDHFSVELSNVKVTGDKVTYTCTFSTDSYKKMGVAPLVTVEEAVFIGGKIKSQTINVSPESLAKIQAAMAAQAKSATSPDPGSQIKALVNALNAGNVDAAMAFYMDDVIRTQQPPPSGQTGVWTGKEQVRGVVKGMIDDHFNVEISNLKVVGDKATYTCTFSTDSYKKMGVAPLVVQEEAVFVGGKIKTQSVTVAPESLAKIQAAMAAAQAKAAAAPDGEVLATKNEDVFGVWLVIYSPSDRFASAENHWEHTAGGDRIATFISGAMKGYSTTAKYWFEGGLYKIQYPQGSTEPNSTAIGTYQVYVTKQGSKAVQLRFVMVDDGYVQRADRMTFKVWTRVQP